MCDFSGRGPTADGNQGIDMVAPGVNITSLNSDTTFIPESMSAYKGLKLSSHYRNASGTSASCAAVAGMAALILEKNPQLTPEEVTSLLDFSCKSLNMLKVHQGSGMPDLNRIVEQ